MKHPHRPGLIIIMLYDSQTNSLMQWFMYQRSPSWFLYRGFDLANHFCEWAISYNSNSFSMEPERYPTRQQQVCTYIDEGRANFIHTLSLSLTQTYIHISNICAKL